MSAIAFHDPVHRDVAGTSVEDATECWACGEALLLRGFEPESWPAHYIRPNESSQEALARLHPELSPTRTVTSVKRKKHHE